jgi:hypothetical protein
VLLPVSITIIDRCGRSAALTQGQYPDRGQPARYRLDSGGSELAAPPGEPVVAGAMCAAPEGSGFQVAFHDLTITRPAKSP